MSGATGVGWFRFWPEVADVALGSQFPLTQAKIRQVIFKLKELRYSSDSHMLSEAKA